MKAEVLIFIVIPVFIFILWALWFRLTNWLNNKNYSQENDKGRKAEDARRALIAADDRRKPSAPARESETEQRVEFQDAGGQGVVSPAAPVPIEQDGDSTGKAGSSPRGFFGRFRRKT